LVEQRGRYQRAISAVMETDGMAMKPGLKDLFRMTVGVAVLVVLVILGLHFQKLRDTAAREAFKAKRVELVDSMQLGLASASEAEKSAVMAVTDETSRAYADEARAATAAVDRDRQDLEDMLKSVAAVSELDLLGRFTESFAEFKRVDRELLDLAVKNTNLKAYDLAFGPAAAAVREMDAALAGVVAAHSSSAAAENLKVVELADGARISALRVLAMLPPHIAEESDQKMDEIEAAISKEDEAVRGDLDSLTAMPGLAGNADLAAAVASYARFAELKAQIIKLSRENTNVRSLTISLNQKRQIMLTCQSRLDDLEKAIQAEPIPGLPARAPALPR
jgi:hypothetical protein